MLLLSTVVISHRQEHGMVFRSPVRHLIVEPQGYFQGRYIRLLHQYLSCWCTTSKLDK